MDRAEQAAAAARDVGLNTPDAEYANQAGDESSESEEGVGAAAVGDGDSDVELGSTSQQVCCNTCIRSLRMFHRPSPRMYPDICCRDVLVQVRDQLEELSHRHKSKGDAAFARQEVRHLEPQSSFMGPMSHCAQF